MKKIIHRKKMLIIDFIKKFRDPSFLEYCKKCRNYKTNWACPPLSFEPESFLAKYTEIEIFAVQIKFSQKEILDSVGKDITKYSLQTLRDTQLEYCEKFLQREKSTPASISLFPGSCIYCKTCTRALGQPCRHPEKMRYSMDSFNFDLTKIMQSLFSLELLWGQDRIPDYYCLIYGFLK